MSMLVKAAGMALGLSLVLVLTLMAFGLPVGESLGFMVEGAFGNKAGLARTLVKTTPLLLAGLGMVIAWRAGIYNIGGEGQLLMGALLGAALARPLLNQASFALTLLILLASVAGGALWGGLAGWLQVRRGVPAVISTILLNFIAIQLLDWAVNGPLKGKSGGVPLTDRLPEAAMLARFDPQTDLHLGFLIALGCLGVVWVLLYFTRFGFQVRLVGENPKAARTARVPVGSVQVKAMLLSGALCGLAGGIEYTGMAGQVGSGFSQNWGFLAIPVALLGALHPSGTGLSALYFGAMFAGSENLARFTPLGTTLISIIQAAAVLGFVAFGSWFKGWERKRAKPA